MPSSNFEIFKKFKNVLDAAGGTPTASRGDAKFLEACEGFSTNNHMKMIFSHF